MTTPAGEGAAVTVASPAKINLQLAVGPVRPDGYHPLATVYQAIDVYDEVTVRPAAGTALDVVGEGVDTSAVPTDRGNLALRAAELLAGHAGLDRTAAAVAVTIRKRIPVAGGMAGGSTDAAAALLACDAVWGLGTPRGVLLELAGRLGSDVPFCLLGGTAAGTGRGEEVRPVEDAGSYWWVVVPGGEGLSTPEVYGEFDRMHGTGPENPTLSEALLDALAAGDVDAVAASLSNDLQAAALRLRPDLHGVLETAGRPPARASLLSGSGPTCLALAAGADDAEVLRARLLEVRPEVLVARGPVPGAHVLPNL